MKSVHCATSDGIFFDALIAWLLAGGRIMYPMYILAQHFFRKVSRIPLFRQFFALCEFIGGEGIKDGPQCWFILSDILASCITGQQSVLTIYTVIEDFSANCL
jgi:hypothetical protein